MSISDPKYKLNLVVYYNSKESLNLTVIQDFFRPNKLQQTNVVYQFTCPFSHDKLHVYIGHTSTMFPASRKTLHELESSSLKEMRDVWLFKWWLTCKYSAVAVLKTRRTSLQREA